MAIEKEQRPAFPKGQFFQIFLFMLILFVLLDPRLRAATGHAVGFALNPLIGFGGHLPILTILLASLVMVGASTLIRHLLVDWVKLARIQNTMRSFQKAMREARTKRDMKRVEDLQKFQSKLLTLQSELSKSQLKPMAGTMLVVIPVFAWLFEFITALPYQFFSAPWNPTVEMFQSTVLPHWILFYGAISIPFGALLQKLLKYYSWKEHWHLLKPKQESQPAQL